MKISVVIPVYNGEEYIAQCLEVMRCQTHKDLEVIVVNDGSTDNTPIIAGRFPVKIVNQENRGIPAARNAGMNCATGEYIHFMDVDDLINVEFYEKAAAAALDADADIACVGIVHERLPGLSIHFNERLVVSRAEDKLFLTNVRNQGICGKYLFRSSFLKSNGLTFDEELRNAQDLVFSFQAVYFADKIVSVPNAVYYHKCRKNSVTTAKGRSHRAKRRQYVKRANQICEEFAKRHGIETVSPPPKTVEYKLFGIPICKKLILSKGKERWYLFGIYLLQRKSING